MIVRILGEGQYRLSDADVPDLDGIDDRLTAAIEVGDRVAFQADFAELIEHVRRRGSALAVDHLASSDIVLPAADATFEEVRAMLSADGLVPG